MDKDIQVIVPVAIDVTAIYDGLGYAKTDTINIFLTKNQQ